MFNKHSNKITFIVILLVLTVATLFAYKKTASFFGFAKTIKSVNKMACGFRGSPCCSNSSIVRTNNPYGDIDVGKSYYCTDKQTRCVNQAADSFDFKCLKLEDVCGFDFRPCCHDNSCRYNLKCVKDSSEYNTPGYNPWYSKRQAPKGQDNPQLSFGICSPIFSQITVTPGGPECGKHGGPCCPVNKCDDYKKDICLYKNNQTRETPICEDRSNATLSIYYDTDGGYNYKEITENTTITPFKEDNTNYISIEAKTNVVSQRPDDFFVQHDRVFMFACDYHSDNDYKFLRDQPNGLWGNDSQTYCDYSNVDITKPVTIAVKMYMISPWEEPNPDRWPFIDYDTYFKQEVKRTVNLSSSISSPQSPSPTSSPSPTIFLPPQPSSSLPGALNGPCKPPPLRCDTGLVCNNTSKTCVKK